MAELGFENLRVWKLAIAFAKDVYLVTQKLPKEETFGLTQQIRRSAVSIASNIAEGASRNSKKEFTQFLAIALGSAAELKTQLIIARDVFTTLQQPIDDLLPELNNIQKMLGSLKKSTRDE